MRKFRALSRLAWPGMIEPLAQMGLGLADTLFIAHIGLSAVGAIGVASSVLLLQSMCYGLVARTTTSLVAQSLGGEKFKGKETSQDNRESCSRVRLHNAQTVTIQAIYQSIAVSVVLGVLFSWFAPLIFQLYGADQQMSSLGVPYLRIVSLFSVFHALLLTLGNSLKGFKDTKSAMKAGIWLNLVHLLFDALFILVMDLNIVGAAWATVLARFVSFCYIALIARQRLKKKFPWKLSWKIDWRFQQKLTSDAIPLVGERLADQGVMAYFNQSFLGFGANLFAVFRITNQIRNILSYPWITGYSSAVTPFVGAEYGARNRREAVKYTTCAIGCIVLGTGVLWIFQFLAGPWIIGLFTDNPQSVQQVMRLLAFVIALDLIIGISNVVTSALQASSDTKSVFYSMGVGSLVLLVGVWCTNQYQWGYEGLLMSQFLQAFCSAVLASVIFFSRKWKS